MHKYFFVRFSIALAIFLLPHLAVAETCYVKKSGTKLQGEASARTEVLGKHQKGTPVKVKKISESRYQKACLYPVLEKRLLSELKRPIKL